jgi:putative copper resistance protein D
VAGFIDVLLRGAILVFASVMLGGVVWTRWVLGAEPHAKPAPATALALRAMAAASAAAAAAQACTLLVALSEVGGPEGWPLAAFLSTTFARAALVRVGLALAVGGLALILARRATGPTAWNALSALALAFVVTSAVLSHAVARVEQRAVLLTLDALHQVAAAVWIGGLAHLTLWATRRGDDGPLAAGVALLRRFSNLALAAVLTLIAAGIVLSWRYVGELAAYVGTAYGVMILSKTVLLVAMLALGAANLGMVRRAGRAAGPRLLRFVEVELGLGLTVLFAAASLTSLPPAIDVDADRATVAEVAARFVPTAPRLTSPPVAELIAKAEPLMNAPTRRDPVERAWSEYNHHWAGVFVLTMGLLACLERLGVRAARHWPLVFFGMAAFMFVRNDPRAWPLGPAGFWESLTLPDVLQHRAFVLLVIAFGVFEWMVRTERLPRRPWGYVFPMLAAAGGALLLTHSHAMFNLKTEFLSEVTHAPLGVLGAFCGWARWVELRLPEAGRGPGWLSTLCLTAVGLILLVYREA